MAHLPSPPASLKSVSHFMKVAVEHDSRDPVVAYWARLTATQKSLQIDKSSPEAKEFLITTLDWLEKAKKMHKENEAIGNETVAQAHLENYALKLFNYADECDRIKGVFNKNVVKAFYTSSILIDVLENFGELGEDFEKMRKYGKWKAAYIHNCLKNGEVPLRGESEEYSHPHNNSSSSEPADNESAGTSNNRNHFSNPPAEEFYPQPATNDPPPNPPSYNQQQQPAASNNATPATSSSSPLPLPISADSLALAQKHTRFATSALNFDDVPTAIENLRKALALLENC